MSDKGREVRLWIKSKAPFDKFGDMLGMGAFEGDGDNATFNTKPVGKEYNETARAYMYVDIDTEEKRILWSYADSSGSKNFSTGEVAKAEVLGNATYNKETNEVSFDYHGANPLVSVAPKIDVEGKLKFTNESNGNLHVEGSVYGDGFPATGASLHFDESKGNGVMLRSSPIEAGTSKNYGPMQLIDLDLPFTQKEIMHINLSIGFEGKTPVSVTDIDANKSYSVDAWNAMHESKPMVDCFKNTDIVDNHVTRPDVEECITDTKETLFVSDKGIIIGGDYTKNIDDIRVKQTGVEQNNTLDIASKAHEILDKANLNDFNQSNEYNNSMDYGMDMGD